MKRHFYVQEMMRTETPTTFVEVRRAIQETWHQFIRWTIGSLPINDKKKEEVWYYASYLVPSEMINKHSKVYLEKDD